MKRLVSKGVRKFKWILTNCKKIWYVRLPTFLFTNTWKTNIISPCKELKMANRYLNAIVSRLNTNKPNSHVSPRIGSSIAEPFRPTFAFLKVLLVFVLVPAILEDMAFRRARMKIIMLIWKQWIMFNLFTNAHYFL